MLDFRPYQTPEESEREYRAEIENSKYRKLNKEIAAILTNEILTEVFTFQDIIKHEDRFWMLTSLALHSPDKIVKEHARDILQRDKKSAIPRELYDL